ncbi:MAG: class I SAM-dependent methyltransferase [Planctomycetaceae bacterium]
MPLELVRRFRNLTGPARRKHFDDDFNWDTYTVDKYGPQQRLLDQQFDLRVDERVYFDAVSKTLETGTARLIPNSKTIYEIVGMLGVQSVLEIGCGGGDHIRNLKTLYPNLTVHGGDRSEEQLKFLQDRNPEIADRTFLQDITMPLSKKWPRVDLVYSQAVIMHIKTAVSHLNALANMFNLASDYVVLVENFGCHHFADDIRRLHDGGHLNWDQVHLYVHHYDGQPYGLIASRQPCELPPLEDYFSLPHARKIRY